MSYLFRGLLVITLSIAPLSGALEPGGGPVPLMWNEDPAPGVAGYKLYYGTESRNYTKAVDAGVSSQVVLSDLVPGETYYCAVTAYDSLGIESDYSPELEFTYPAQTVYKGPYDRLVLLTPQEILGDVDLGGLTVLPGDRSFRMQFDAPIGADYVVWCRVKAPTSGSDEFFMKIDGGAEVLFYAYGKSDPGSYSADWFWVKVDALSGGNGKFSLDPGPHTIELRTREEASLDSVMLTSDPNFHPDEAVVSGGDVVAITLQPRSRTISSGTATTLSVVAVSTGELYYQWFKDGSPIPGETSRSLVIESADKADAGTYHVTVATGGAEEVSEPIVLQVVDGTPGLRIASMSIGANHSVTLDIVGGLGASLSVHVSQDMVRWFYLTTVANTTGTVIFSDPAIQWQPRRFYRVAVNAEK